MLFKRKKELTIEELENNVFLSLQYYRLKYDLDSVNEELKKYELKDDVKKYDLFGKLNNHINGSFIKDLNKEKTKILEGIDRIKDNNSEESYNMYLDGTLDEAISKLFLEDKYQMNKYLLSIRLLLDNEYSYRANNKSLEMVSGILYNGDKTKLNEINTKLQQIYIKIAKKPLSANQKSVIFALAALSIATLGIGSVVAEGSIALTGSAIASLLSIGILAGSMDLYNKAQIKKDYKSLTVEESAFFLTLKLLLIEQAKSMMPKNEFKENLNEILESIDDMKSEVGYLLFVENAGIDENKEKLNQFHNFDKLMLNVFSL